MFDKLQACSSVVAGLYTSVIVTFVKPNNCSAAAIVVCSSNTENYYSRPNMLFSKLAHLLFPRERTVPWKEDGGSEFACKNTQLLLEN